MKNNKLNVDGFIQMEQMKHDFNSVKMKMINDIAKECANITHPDRCESAARIYRCIHNAAAARHLEFEV